MTVRPLRCFMSPISRIPRADRVPDRGDHRDAVSARGGLAHRRYLGLHGTPSHGRAARSRACRPSPARAPSASSRSNPTWYSASPTCRPTSPRELVRAGLEVHVFNHRSIADILRMIRTLGGMIGCEAKARALTEQLEAGLAAVRARAARFTRRPRVYFEEWDDPLISGIRWVSELVTLAGGEECFPELAARGARARTASSPTPLEVARRAPDIVLGSWCGKKFRPASVAARPGWAGDPGGARRLRARDQVIAHPAARACGAHRRRARDPGGHRAVGGRPGVAARRLDSQRSDTAPLAHQFPGLDDLLGALLGVLDHRVGQPIGLELVRMMAVQLAAIGLGDLLIARARCALEHA